MIYSKTNKFHDIKMSNGDYLENCKFEDDDIFYHHHKNNIKIFDCIEPKHWEHISNNRNVKLLHVNSTETMGYGFALALDQVIKTYKINPNQIYVIVYDTIHKTFLENELKKLDITGINIGVFDGLFTRTIAPNKNVQTIKKFSALSRNFKVCRLRLFLNLLEHDLLDDFIYSFYNMNAWEETPINIEEVLQKEKIKVDERIMKWVSKIPYTFESESIENILASEHPRYMWGDVSYESILSTDLHLVVETLFDYKPSVSFITEKTYKALACSKPFLVFSTKGFLADLRATGYNTCSPYIDESYDTIDNDEERLLAIVNEIKRIKDLNDSDYSKLLSNCNLIANENFKIFKRKKEAGVNEDNFNRAFDFLKPYLQKYEGWDFPIVIL
jgi:hypothetical protein